MGRISVLKHQHRNPSLCFSVCAMNKTGVGIRQGRFLRGCEKSLAFSRPLVSMVTKKERARGKGGVGGKRRASQL